ncbi:MAG: family 78 glycoside hydrolase catalytic domain [Nocardioides alkalitolerans]
MPPSSRQRVRVRSLLARAVSAGLVVGVVAAGAATTAGASGATPVAAPVTATEPLATAPLSLSVNGLPAPVDVEGTPAFGWHVPSARQTAYELVVATSAAAAAAGQGDVWSSGRVTSDQQTGIAYGGPALAAEQRYFWAVRTVDAAGAASTWSAPASFGTGPTWDGSAPIWAASPADSWRDYTIAARVRVDEVATGVTFRAVDPSNSLMWQFRADTNRLVPHTQVRGTYTALPAVDLPAGAVRVGEFFDLRIEVVGAQVRTYVGDALVHQYSVTASPQDARGVVGVRNGRSESATYDSLRVTAADGTVLAATGFDTGDRTFGCATAAGGSLTVPRGAVCLLNGVSADWAMLRGAVDLPGKEVAWATLSATASDPRPAKQYVHKLYLNGEFVGLGPTQPVGGETRYDGFDVTDLVVPGQENVVGAVAYATSGQQFQAELVVAYTDGTRTSFGTSPETWEARTASDVWPAAGSIGTSYFTAPKENLDLRAYPEGWDEPGYDASAWPAATERPALTNLAATPTDKVKEQLRAPVRIVEKAPGHYFVDFGRAWIGGVRYDVAGGTDGARVDLRFGEITSSTDTVRYQLNTGNTYQDVVTLRDGQQTVETWGARVFRYVEIIGAPEPVTTENLSALALVYPFDADASRFASSDDNLNQVYALSKNTIEATNLNFYTDSWTRERTNYEADAYLQQMSTLYLMDDLSLGRYSMDYFRGNRTWPTEWPIYVALAVHDAWRQTGDLTQPAAYYDNLKEKMPDEWIDPSTGLIGKDFRANGCNSQTDCDIVDWPASERDGYQFRHYNTVLNALTYRAWTDMAAMATALGRAEDAATYGQRAARLRASMNELLLDEATGRYDDGMDASYQLSGHQALHASAFALAFGVPEDDQRDRVAAAVAERGMACSVYCAGFLVPGLFDGGEDQAAIDLLTGEGTRSWMNMIRLGAGATAEAWDPSLKPNLTYSHPWAASPAFSVPAGLFGIEPLTPGYATFAVRPRPGDLAWGTIATPTVRGSVGVGFDRDTDDASLRLAVSVPGNTSATVSLPTEATTPQTVYVDGSPRTVAPVDGALPVTRLGRGCHVLSTEAEALGTENDARLLGVCEEAPAEGLAIEAVVEPVGIDGWLGADATVTLATTGDPGVGGTVVEHALGDAGWTTYTEPFTLPEGATTLRYRWRDGDVVLAQGSRDVVVDRGAPTVTPSLGAGRTLQVESADPLSGVATVEYRRGDGEWQPWTGPVALGDAAVSVTVRATDKAGNAATQVLDVPRYVPPPGRYGVGSRITPQPLAAFAKLGTAKPITVYYKGEDGADVGGTVYVTIRRSGTSQLVATAHTYRAGTTQVATPRLPNVKGRYEVTITFVPSNEAYRATTRRFSVWATPSGRP